MTTSLSNLTECRISDVPASVLSLWPVTNIRIGLHKFIMLHACTHSFHCESTCQFRVSCTTLLFWFFISVIHIYLFQHFYSVVENFYLNFLVNGLSNYVFASFVEYYEFLKFTLVSHHRGNDNTTVTPKNAHRSRIRQTVVYVVYDATAFQTFPA